VHRRKYTFTKDDKYFDTEPDQHLARAKVPIVLLDTESGSEDSELNETNEATLPVNVKKTGKEVPLSEITIKQVSLDPQFELEQMEWNNSNLETDQVADIPTCLVDEMPNEQALVLSEHATAVHDNTNEMKEDIPQQSEAVKTEPAQEDIPQFQENVTSPTEVAPKTMETDISTNEKPNALDISNLEPTSRRSLRMDKPITPIRFEQLNKTKSEIQKEMEVAQKRIEDIDRQTSILSRAKGRFTESSKNLENE